MIDRDFFDIDWQLFHFLRPEWLWLFAPLLIVLILTLLSNKEKSNWKKLIAPHLRPHVFSRGNRSAIVFPLIFLFAAGSLITMAIAGPTWKRTEIPGAKSTAVLYIALDMSRSMMATDIQPTRLERAKFKIKDLLEANPRARTGLMVFAGTAHPVISICEDYHLILHQIESLTPYIMPRAGSNFGYAFDLIDTVMSRIEAPSTLLLITDELDESKTAYLRKFVNETPHRIELMVVATPAGAKVPGWQRGTYFENEQGKHHISARNDALINRLTQHPKISATPLTLDDSDVEGIADRVSKSLVFKKAGAQSEEEWQDMGYFLVLPILLIVAFWFRKGFMVQLAMGAILLGCAPIESWDDLWYSGDFQGQKLYDDGLYQQSADQFESFFHKGVAMYKSGDIESAIYFFEQDSLDARSQYNLGLSYAQLGYYDQALNSFEQAATLDPQLKQARQNITRTRQQMLKTDSLARLTGEPKRKFISKNDKDQRLKERQAKGKDEELTSDTEVEELPESGDRVTDMQETGIRKAEELTEVPDDFDPQQGVQAQDILLREISADPSEFLKRKFEYQFKKYYKDNYVQEEYW